MPSKAGVFSPFPPAGGCVAQRGFTLLEILIALFIFSILSLMMSSGLRSVIDAQSGTEMSADRLRELQFASLMLSRDIEQAVNRPVLNAQGKEEPSFIGTNHSVTFTHSGNAAGVSTSQLQRVQYVVEKNALWRVVWDAVDRADGTKSYRRQLLGEVSSIQFSYLDEKRQFHVTWPFTNNSQLPLAVRMSLTFSQYGAFSQLYVLSVHQPAQILGQPPAAPKS